MSDPIVCRDLESALAVPYVLQVEARIGSDGRWVARVEHPELDGCVAESSSILEALDDLDQQRVRLVTEHFGREGAWLAPRFPLGTGQPLQHSWG